MQVRIADLRGRWLEREHVLAPESSQFLKQTAVSIMILPFS